MDKEKLDELKIQLQQLLNEAQEFVQQIPPAQLCTAVGVVLFTVFLFTVMYYLLKHRSANTILLTGLSGSGKTVLFYQLRDGSCHQGSVTSTKPNEGRFLLHSEANKLQKGKMKHVHVVDVPGHSRLLAKLDEFLSRAAGIVFVVDSVEFLPHLRIASEYLYDILTNASVVKRKTPLLLLCNKIDRVTAHSMDFIRRQLEKEMTVLSSADTSDEHTLGVVGEAFAFSQCHNKVTTAEASGLTGDIYHLEQFISECVKP
ncbi:signal recognition particle receptor subunit beta-like isoform X1 [Salvia divinorum]|uniref:Signal recognition particle receptor subunit beta n=1 Tax=Salvia divinorum TaxID=28513 RepID=A0ABD1H362_SALDI